MRARFYSATDVREALVSGQLERAHSVARKLARPVRLEDLPEPARVHTVRVHLHAQEVAEARTLTDATAAFASLMNVCGDCHASAGVAWTFDVPPVPEGDALDHAMARHAWAVERMWEGLIIASPEQFDRGAAVLAEAPLLGLGAPDDEHPTGASALATELHRVAQQAPAAPDMASRSALFSEMLVTCSSCHALVAGIDQAPSPP